MPLFRPSLLLAIVLAFVPAAPAQSGGATPAAPASATARTVRINRQAASLMERVDRRLFALKSYQAGFTWRYHRTFTGGSPAQDDRVAGTLRLMKPNYSFSEGWVETQSAPGGQWKKTRPTQVFASDGRWVYRWLADTNLYSKSPADRHGANINPGFNAPLHAFFVGARSFSQMLDQEKGTDQSLLLRLADPAAVNGHPCRVVEIDTVNTYANMLYQSALDYYVGSDLLVRRTVLRLTSKGGETNITLDIDPVAPNAPLTAASFAYAPPASALNPPQATLLASGAVAPDFTLRDAAGQPVRLSSYKGKIVVLDFWATWCDPCQQSLPETNKVAEQFRDKGVVFLAVNVWDKRQAFDAWLPKHKAFDALVFAIDPSRLGADIASTLYRVGGIPTQYVIDPSGKIVASFVGYPQPAGSLAAAIEKAAGAF